MSKPVSTVAVDTSLATNYGVLDRILHRIAFAHPKVQQILSDVEDDLFRKRLSKISIDRPVFITGLPRAGTTLLLEMLYETGEFSTYTYRQMPFVLAPLLWNRITGKSRKQAMEQERAHGDGMVISTNSPEAFEEILWSHRLADKLVRNGCQHPLSFDDLSDEFRSAFVQLIRKIVALAEDGQCKGNQSEGNQSEGNQSEGNQSEGNQSEGNRPEREQPEDASASSTVRYLSKNNANVARLSALSRLLPDSIVLLCFRHPGTHVASLTTQHDRFTKMHQDDAFSRQYMAWTAHHDFGANFIPISFDGASPGQPGPVDHRFWLKYWVDAYRHVLEHADNNVKFISYEILLAEPGKCLESTARHLGLNAPERLVTQAEKLRSGGSRQLDLVSIDASLASEASEIHDALMVRAAQTSLNSTNRLQE